MSFDAIATDRSTASLRIWRSARCVSSSICRSAVRTIDSASARAFWRISSFSRSASERLRETIDSASTRASRTICADSCCSRCSSCFAWSRVVQRLPDRLLTRLERLQQRPPRELPRAAPAGPGTSTIVQMNSPGSGWTRVAHRLRYLSGSARTAPAARTLRPRIATPSSRNSGRFTAPVILSAAPAGGRCRPRRPPPAARCPGPRR